MQTRTHPNHAPLTKTIAENALPRILFMPMLVLVTAESISRKQRLVEEGSARC